VPTFTFLKIRHIKEVFEELYSAHLIRPLQMGSVPEVKEITVSNLIGKSNILDYTINPYGGCGIGCIYCYARYVGKVYGKRLNEWGRYVYPKVNAPLLASREAKRVREGSIYISSLTDPYQPLEAKYKITRKILEALLRYKDKLTLVIQTKSTLVLRDIDLIEKFERVKVGFTIVCDDEWSKLIEPKASSPTARIEALKILKERGISTYAFIGPILPLITDPFEILANVRSHVDEAYFDKLNLRPGVWRSLMPLLRAKGLEKTYRRIMFGRDNFYEKMRKRIFDYCSSVGVECHILF